jgi:hypothetical protein
VSVSVPDLGVFVFMSRYFATLDDSCKWHLHNRHISCDVGMPVELTIMTLACFFKLLGLLLTKNSSPSLPSVQRPYTSCRELRSIGG